jgi:tetratricopeptide (TPR) repeat protein
MCIGLHFIHRAGDMAHGDVRSDNVMFHEIPAGGGEAQGAGRYFLKITNVGLWAAFQNKKIFCDPSGAVLPEFAGEGLARTLSGFMTPSLLWCAPELLESVSAPNVSTDAYAFGVIFYEMLTGLLPFSGSTPSDLLKNIQEVAPEHPSVINTGVPIAAGNIAMKCLEEKPSARFKNFFEIGDALVRHIEESVFALKELAELCGRYRKISRFQFNDEQSGETMMIVGGTEFSSEVGQLWEINRRRAETENNASLKERLENNERALSMPGHTIGEVYSNLSGIADALSALAPYEHREELHAIGSEARDEAPEDIGAGMDFTLEVSVEAPGEDALVIPREIPASSTAEVFGPEIAARYSSLIIVADSNQAARMLARGFTLCAEALLLESPNGSALVAAFSEVAASSRFPHWLGPIFEELSAVSDCPGPRNFLENGMQTEREIIAAVCGFVFMLGDKFTEALETFNMISDSRYPSALNIYVWAMSKFRSPAMETIRLNSLRNASGLLKESIIADKNSSQRGTLIISSHPGAAPADTLFLRGLVLEQLGKHKRAVAHLRECKKLLSAGEGVARNPRPWAELVQGKCLYELGMPSEGFMRWQRALIQELRPPSFAFLELGPSKPGALIADHVLQCCEGALSRFKASAMLWCVKGKLLNRIGRGPDAIECAERAFEIEESHGPAHFIVMEASLLAGKYDDALKALKICTLREPHEPLFMLREAEILCLLGQAEEALHELKRAVSHKLDPAELKASVRRERLAALEQFGEFAEITGGLESD